MLHLLHLHLLVLFLLFLVQPLAELLDLAPLIVADIRGHILHLELLAIFLLANLRRMLHIAAHLGRRAAFHPAPLRQIGGLLAFLEALLLLLLRSRMLIWLSVGPFLGMGVAALALRHDLVEVLDE